jgi:anthranilate synthase/aminodeoxychorismate synthase-like glutamine amidotransferase
VILLIDNYDSFVYTLARYVRELGEEPLVRRHDALSLDDIAGLAPSHIIISPGPCTPREAGISTEVVRRFGPTIPILGVCLGHQCIGAAYGGRIVRATRPMHGKRSRIHHTGEGIFASVPSPLNVTRYHSLVIERTSIPPAIRITAATDDGEIMAVQHKTHPVTGVQFHPESALTEHGYTLLDAFLFGAERQSRPSVPDRADGRWSAETDAASGGDEGGDSDTDAPPPASLVH